MIASRDHNKITGHAVGEGSKLDIVGKVGKWWSVGYAKQPKAKPKAKPGSKGFGDRIRDLFKENTEELSAAQLLQVHI